MFGQTFEYQDLAVVALLIVLEGVLSIDNALVLGLLAKRLPEKQRQRALMYGLVGAFVFRIIAIIFAQYLLSIKSVKVIGGGYLLFVACKFFWQQLRSEASEKIVADEDAMPTLVGEDGLPLTAEQTEEELESRLIVPAPELSEIQAADPQFTTAQASRVGGVERTGQIKFAKFWPTVVVIELTDIAFAVDSILAAIALVGAKPESTVGAFHPKLWVVVAGGMLGVVLMRFAAAIFIKLLERFPRFEISAYLLVTVIGVKLVLDYLFNDYWKVEHVMDFHHISSPAFWVFWSIMLASFLVGFIPPKKANVTPANNVG
jgi:YkoY family integral membrane protein